MASFEARKYVDAIVALQASLEDQRKPLTDQQRVKVKNLLKRAEVLVGYIDLRIEPPSAVFTVDGRKPTYYNDRVLADPGERQIVVNAEGYHTLTRQLSVRGGSTETAAITLEPMEKDILGQPQPVEEIKKHEKTAPLPDETPKDDADNDWVPWLTLGGATLTVIAGGVLLTWALTDVSTVEDAKYETPWKDVESAHDRSPIISTVGFVLLGVGAVGAVTGIVLLATGEPEQPNSVSLIMRPNGLVLNGAM